MLVAELDVLKSLSRHRHMSEALLTPFPSQSGN